MDNFKIDNDLLVETKAYCELNDLNHVDFINDIIKKGYMEKKYGALLVKSKETDINSNESEKREETKKPKEDKEVLKNLLSNDKGNLYNE